MTRDLDKELEDALSRDVSRSVARDIEEHIYPYPMEGGIDRTKIDRHKDSRKIQVWVPEWLYDQCRELVGIAGGYKSLSELVRDGMEKVLDENIDTLSLEISERTKGIEPGSTTEFNLGKNYGTITMDALWWHSQSPISKGEHIDKLEYKIDHGMHIRIPYKGEG